MRERPILFSTPMVRAIINGQKSQTRRVVKDASALITTDDRRAVTDAPCPYGQPGDRLWVREKFTVMPSVKADFEILYDATDTLTEWIDNENKMAYPVRDRTHPSIHMPRWASRLTLEVVSVGVERVQDITATDAEAEGIESIVRSYGLAWRDYRGEPGAWFASPITSFASLWDSINASRGYGWSVNPYVWRVEFRKVTK